jgi:hypothetical protein
MTGMNWVRAAALGMAVAAGLATAGVCAPAPASRSADPPKPAAVDPPPPASLENRDVEAWADAYLHTEGWTLLTHNLEGAHLTSQRGALKARDGLLELEIRTELFHPVAFSRGAARSGVALWSVDCAKKRLAILSMTAFAHNNMQGELGKKTVGVRDWREPNEGESATFGVICSVAKTGKGFSPKSLAPISPS